MRIEISSNRLMIEQKLKKSLQILSKINFRHLTKFEYYVILHKEKEKREHKTSLHKFNVTHSVKHCTISKEKIL